MQMCCILIHYLILFYSVMNTEHTHMKYYRLDSRKSFGLDILFSPDRLQRFDVHQIVLAHDNQ